MLLSFADHLSDQVRHIIIDKTGLTGKYNLQLSWSPDDAGTPAPDSSAPPDIFTALVEQLGLKLQPGNAEIESFVIDHTELFSGESTTDDRFHVTASEQLYPADLRAPAPLRLHPRARL